MGKSSNTKMLLVLAVLVLGIYVLPSAVAKFAGSHTWEKNQTAGVAGLQCGVCHTYIKNEIDFTGAVGGVANIHKNASNNSAYVNSTAASPGAIYINATPTGTTDDVCWMCHVVENDASVGGTHTKVVIRVCNDLDCHGDTAGTRSGEVFGASTTNITGQLNGTSDAHANFYNPLTTRDSDVANEDGGNYNLGYVACLACHTYVGLDIEFERPNKLILNMTYNGTATSQSWKLRGNGVTVNVSSMNISTGGKPAGSVW